MRHFTRVQTTSENNYVIGNSWYDGMEISNMTINYDALPLEIEIWATKNGKDEQYVASIPYHAVELLVK